jgi:hypothetical protein
VDLRGFAASVFPNKLELEAFAPKRFPEPKGLFA